MYDGYGVLPRRGIDCRMFGRDTSVRSDLVVPRHVLLFCFGLWFDECTNDSNNQQRRRRAS